MEERIENITEMKYLYLFNNESRAAQYGIGTYIRQMISCLKRKDVYLLNIVNIDSAHKELQEEYNDGIRYINIPAIHGIYRYSERYYKNIAFLLFQYIEEEAECIFHFNYIHHLLLAKRLKQRFRNSKIIVTIHYFNWCSTLQGNISYFCSILWKDVKERNPFEANIFKEWLRDKELLLSVDRIICLSEVTKKLLVEYYDIVDNRMSLIYNGLQDEAQILSKEEIFLKKEQMYFRSNEQIILFVGRLDVVKGIDFLLEAFREVLNQISDVRLLIVGDGEYEEILKRCTGLWGKVTFTGKVSKSILYEFYQIADIGVMPSFHEQCSYVGIEMLMHGIPLIGTSAIGLGEMILRELCIDLEEKDDMVIFPIDKLSTLMINMLVASSKEKYALIERQRYKERYSLDVMSESVLECYENL